MTTWNASDKAAGITLSGSNLVATVNTATASGVRSTTSNSSGKLYFEATATNIGGTTWRIGIANASQSLTNSFGASSTSGAFLSNNGNFDINGIVIGSAASWTTGAVLRVALDIGNKLIWLAVGSGNWNNSGTANPATGVGGFSLATLGAAPYFIGFSGNTISNSVTLNPQGTAFGPPSGYTTWDPPAVSGTESATAAAPTAQASGTLDESGAEQSTAATPTAQAAGHLDESGTEQSTIAAPTAQAAGHLDESGTEQSTAPAPTAQSAGRLDESGTEQSTAPAPASQASGHLDESGAEQASAAAPAAHAAGTLDESGTEQTTAAAPAAQASGTLDESGTEQATAPAPTAQASGSTSDFKLTADPAFTLSARSRVLAASALPRVLGASARPRILILSAKAA